ncbi:hypothetical protein B0T25DRAFT_547392 [Lasiosphaeria hispida]|uniref:Uncharacterized protein n=1 Tax=Lasiosphaeria hispida TaxID=260671 RepID=A0AAJ0MCG8_9PEZI|nr:hypothetical protein B0T25DRAFT_547392 [Lasiosphaeria hispida]
MSATASSGTVDTLSEPSHGTPPSATIGNIDAPSGGVDTLSEPSNGTSPSATIGNIDAPGPKIEPAFTFSNTCRLPDPNLIHLVWERKRDKLSYTYLFDLMALKLVRPFNQASRHGFSSTYFKMNGYYKSIMMKQQDIWVPRVGPGNTATLRTLYEIGHTIMHAESICQHCRWDQEYPFLVPHMADFPLSKLSQDVDPIKSFSLPIAAMMEETELLLEEESRLHERLRCALFHDIGCLCPASICWGAVKSCPRCHTDYAVSVAPVATRPEGRCFVFTTWKYLGKASQDCYWKSHTDQTGLPLRVYELGRMYDGYEFWGNTTSGPQNSIYTPGDDWIRHEVH